MIKAFKKALLSNAFLKSLSLFIEEILKEHFK